MERSEGSSTLFPSLFCRAVILSVLDHDKIEKNADVTLTATELRSFGILLCHVILIIFPFMRMKRKYEISAVFFYFILFFLFVAQRQYFIVNYTAQFNN